MQNSYKKYLYFNDFFMLYEHFYYMVFIRHLAGKIWSSICIQDIVLYYQINLLRLIGLVFYIRFA